MRRVASVFLPQLPIERLSQARRSQTPPETRSVVLPVDDDPGACSVPRGGGWRPGARWAREEAPLAAHRQPPHRELGRRSEAAAHPFRAMAPDDGAPARSSAALAALPSASPLVLAIRDGQREVVHAANADALALGLLPSTPITQARALVSNLVVEPAELLDDAAFLLRLARHAARHWTPVAAVDPPSGLLLDLTGVAHLFGGETHFCRRLAAFLGRLGFCATVAVADTVGAAHALARGGDRPVTIVPPGQTLEALAPLPLINLRLDPDALAAARRFGLERVADLLPLPRGPLARRLGRRAIERLDQAIGRTSEPIVGVPLITPPRAERRLLEPPIKMAISLPPELNQALAEYTALYAETYGRNDALVDLIPEMLKSFLDSDRVFARARKTSG